MLETYYSTFLLKIFRNLVAKDFSKKSNMNPELNYAIKITKFMHNNYYKNITVKDAADFMHVTPRHINRIFKDFFGTTFSKTLSIYRLNYAKNYLCDTNYSVEKIAKLVGYSTPQPIYRLFKEQEGISISEYRALNKKD